MWAVADHLRGKSDAVRVLFLYLTVERHEAPFTRVTPYTK
jgi:hypothetical protein